jgi:hypothetical protein
LGRLTLSEAEKTATDKILADNKDKVAECAKKAAPTADQQAAIKEAMTKARDDGTPMNEMMKVVTAAAKWTDDQTKARTEGAALIKEITTKITEALVGDNKDLFTKALTARGGRGGGKKKAPDATT